MTVQDSHPAPTPIPNSAPTVIFPKQNNQKQRNQDTSLPALSSLLIKADSDKPLVLYVVEVSDRPVAVCFLVSF